MGYLSTSRSRGSVAACIMAAAAMALLARAASVSASSTAAMERPVVVVVGSGLAGLSASVQAHQLGARIIAIEKNKRHGGNSAKATSGINGVSTNGQSLHGVNDSVETLIADTLKSGRGGCVPDLVDVLAHNSASAVSFLESFGIELTNLCQCGGHSAKRTHREPNKPNGAPRPIGFDLISALHKHLDALPEEEFQLRTNTQVVSLLSDPLTHAIVGVSVVPADQPDTEPEGLLADAVILATGGYSWDTEGLLNEHAPSVAGLPTTNGPWATGDGVKLALEAGAATRLMEHVQVHPTGFVDPKDPEARVKFLAPEAFRGSGGILLNRKGQRFVNELGTRDVVTGSIFRHSPLNPADITVEDLALPVHEQRPVKSEAILLLTEPMVEAFGSAAFGFYAKVKGFFQKVTGPEGVAEAISAMNPNQPPVSADVVREVLVAYGAAARGEAADEFGKTVFPSVPDVGADEPYFLARITPSIHYTMGGLAIDAQARVLRAEASQGVCSGEEGEEGCREGGVDATDPNAGLKPINGLFAAGEVAGGVHGNNRLAGNSLLECTVFGRVAAASAYMYANENKPQES